MEQAFTKKIDITIASRKFPLKITEEEESTVREIEKDLNRQIQAFQLQYKDMDKLDSVLMTLVSLAFEKKKEEQHIAQESELSAQLERINTLLDSPIH